MNMEPVGAFPDGEWDFSRMFSMEGLDCFAPELPGPYCSFLLEHNEGPHFATASAFCANSGDDVSITTLNPNLHFISQENSSCSNCSSSAFASGSSQETYSFCNSNHVTETSDMPMSMDVCIMDERITRSFAPLFPEIATTGVNEGIANKELELKRKFDSLELKVNSHNDMKKKPRVSRNVQSNKKNADPRKNQKLITPSSNDEEENNPVAEGQSSSSCNSKDDTNASQDSSGGATSECKAPEALNSTRAGRGSATDPQSLYARKRRERINERLRILQNLVPNGTKVDISTMLEEALHYVKFLQLQIKLLSSDDLWMYAPIAYNGVDIGLNQTISALL